MSKQQSNYSLSVFRIICIVAALFSLLLSSCRQRNKYIDSYIIEKEGKYGLIDSLGNEIVPPSYIHIGRITKSGLAIVIIDTIVSHNNEVGILSILQPMDTLKVKYSYINYEGKYQYPKPFFGSILMKKGYKTEDLLTEFCLNHSFSCEMAMVTDTATMLNGYINVLGDTIIPMVYYNASYFSENIAAVSNIVEFDTLTKTIVKNTGKYGFIDKTGNKVSEFIFSYLSPCYLNRATASIYYGETIKEDEILDEQTIEKDRKGKIFTKPNKYKRSIEDKSIGISHYLVDRQGHIIERLGVAHSYGSFTKDSLAVAEPNKLGIYFGMGSDFLDYDGSTYKTDNKLSTYEKQKIIDSSPMCKGHMPDDFHKLSLTYFSDGYAGVKVGPKEWVFVDKNMMVWQPEDEPYQNVLPFSYGLAAVKYKGEWGYVDTNFDYIIPLKYDSCGIAGKNLCKVYNSTSEPRITSFIDRKGNIVWQNTEYTSAFYTNQNEMGDFSGKWRDIDYQYEPPSRFQIWHGVLCAVLLMAVLLFLTKLMRKNTNKTTHASDHNTEDNAETNLNKSEEFINGSQNREDKPYFNDTQTGRIFETNKIDENDTKGGNNYEEDKNTLKKKPDSQENKKESQMYGNNMESSEIESSNSMSSIAKVIVTIIVITLFFVIFGAIVAIRDSSGHSTPGILGLIVFAAMIGALRAIWKGKGKGDGDNDGNNSSILQD